MMLPRPKKNYKLSRIEEEVLFQHLGRKHSGHQARQLVCLLNEPIDLETFKLAWRRIADRHEALRTTFHWRNGKEAHRCVHEGIRLSWKVKDLSDLTEAQQEVEFSNWCRHDQETGFELDCGPLFRLNLFRLNVSKWILVWSFQPGILDSRSIPIVLDEVFQIYEAQRRGEERDLPAVPSYSDYLQFLSSINLPQAEKYWRKTLHGFARPTPLTTLESPTGEEGHGDEQIQLSPAVAQALAELACRERFTVNNVVEAAWAAVLSRYNGESDIVFGTTRPCRGFQPRTGSMVGNFVNTVPVRVRVTNDVSAFELLREVRSNEIALRHYEHTPLTRIQSWSNLPETCPLFESHLIFHPALLNVQMKTAGSTWVDRKTYLAEEAKFPLALHTYLKPALTLRIVFDRKRFRRETMQQVLGHLEIVLEQIATGIDKNFAALQAQIPELSCDKLIDTPLIENHPIENQTIETPIENNPQQIETLLCAYTKSELTIVPPPEEMSGIAALASHVMPILTGQDPTNFLSEKLTSLVTSGQLVSASSFPWPPESGADPEPSLEHQVANVIESCRNDDLPEQPAEEPEMDIRIFEAWCPRLGSESGEVEDGAFQMNAGFLRKATDRIVSTIKSRREPGSPATLSPNRPVLASPPVPKAEIKHEAYSAAVSTIQPDGNKPPIFFIATLDGEASLFRTLAQELGNEQPVHCLDASMLQLGPSADVNTIAGRCLDELRAAGHDRPFCLAGYRFGGLVALEMAEQLKARGIEVPALVLIETRYSVGCKSNEKLYERLYRYKHHVEEVFRIGKREEDLSHRALVPMVLTAASQSPFQILDKQQRASDRYRARPYPGRACVFTASTPQTSLAGGLKMGWDKIFNDSLSIYYEIPGDSGIIDTAKGAPLMARRIVEFLNGVEESLTEPIITRIAS